MDRNPAIPIKLSFSIEKILNGSMIHHIVWLICIPDQRDRHVSVVIGRNLKLFTDLPTLLPQRNLAEFGMGMNPPIMSREEFEARKADLRRKRELERRGESSREFSKDQEFSREMSSSADIKSKSIRDYRRCYPCKIDGASYADSCPTIHKVLL